MIHLNPAVNLSTQNIATAGTSDLGKENLKKVQSMIGNEIKIGYGPTFPQENKIQDYGLEFSTGHALDLAFLRQHEFFFGEDIWDVNSSKTVKLTPFPLLIQS